MLRNSSRQGNNQRITTMSGFLSILLRLSFWGVVVLAQPARNVADTKFEGFSQSKITAIGNKKSHAILHEHHQARRQLEGSEAVYIGIELETPHRSSGASGAKGDDLITEMQFPFVVPHSTAETLNKGSKASEGGRKGSKDSSKTVNFVQDVFDTAIAVDDFNSGTTPTLKEAGTVFTFSNYTTAEELTNLFSAGLCTRTQDTMSYCDFHYSLQDSQMSGFSASGAVLDGGRATRGGGLLGITGGTGVFFGATGQVRLTPYFDDDQVSNGDFFLDANRYTVNAALLF
jgi:hypothetical protein